MNEEEEEEEEEVLLTAYNKCQKGGKGCLLKEQSREHAWHVPRLYQPSIIMCGRRYTRVCRVRVAQCVYIAQSGSESRTSTKRVPFLY